MKKLVSILLSAIMLLSLVACSGGANPNAGGGVREDSVYGGVLNLAYVGAGGANLDPTGSGWDRYIWSTNVVENFLTRDNDGNIYPGVCEYELSEDNLTLTLWPREGVKFHNGELVTIDDLRASIEYNKTTQMLDYVRALLDEIVMDYDNNKMTLKFSSYNVQTLYQLSSNNCYMCVLPASVWQSYKSKDPNATDEDVKIIEAKDCIGTGPYKIDVNAYVPDYKVSLVRFDDYVQKDETLQGAAGPRYAYLDRINIVYASDSNAVAMGIMKGEFDLASLGSVFLDTMKASNMQVVTDPIGTIGYLAFNTMDFTRNDEYMRKAIAAAIDYETLLEVTYGKGYYTMETSPMGEGPYHTTKFSDADFAGKANVELAKEYLSKSKFKDETIIMLAPSSNNVTGEVIKNMCSEAGIKIKIKYYDDSTYKSMYQKATENDYDFVWQASAQSDLVPATLVTNFRVRFWRNNYEWAEDQFEKSGTLMFNSEESLKHWDELSDAWVENAHVIPIGGSNGTYFCSQDLVVQFPGEWRALYNTYWINPSVHGEQ